LHPDAAEFRGLGVGDSLDLAGAGRRTRLRIGAIVPDGRLTGNEVILSDATGRPLGVTETQALIMAVRADAAAAAEARMTRAVGTFPARIRSTAPGPARPARPTGGVLSLLEVKQTFGEFWYRPRSGIRIEVDPAWVAANIVYARIPVLGVVQCNRKITPLLAGAMTELQRRGLASLVHSYNGCWNPRMQTFDSDALSRHAFGIAIDINAATNGYDKTPTMDSRVVEVMERWGFTWGGRWTIPDGMHFEFAEFPDASPPGLPATPAISVP
ncbi:MAG: M15 family metallopeptidase, partial [Actinomycetota bacterium]